MKKKVFSLMMTLLLAFMGVAKAEVVTIGDGTSTTYYCPFNSLWGYSFVEQVYTADEIGTAGTINSISFNMSSTDAQTNAIDVFMKNVSRSNFSSATDWETVTASDMVFSGTVTFTNGWTTITLDTPFQYDGVSNLMIGMHEYTSGYSTRYFYYTTVTGGMISGHNDSANPDPYNMGSYTGSTYTQNYRANIQIDITPGGGQGGETVEVTIGDPTSTTTNSYLPGYSLYEYAISQQIYTADEIGVGGTINALTMWLKNNSSYARNINVYMKEVSESTFASNTSWVSMTADDMVASFTMNNGITDPVETEITLTTPFSYSGTGNLVICFQDVTGSWSSGLGGVEMDANGNQAMYAYHDGTEFDVSAPGVNGNLLAKKNVVRLNITTGGGGITELSEIIDFEDNAMPEGWTVEGNGSWTVGTGDYTTSTGTHSGSYNALINHSSTGNMTYLVSPMYDFANAIEGTVNCWFINRSWAGDTDYFGVYYRVNGGEWQELYYTTEAHSTWTEMGEIQLTGFANNYQIGFLMEDNYGYGIGLDDIEINVTIGPAPALEPITEVYINDYVAPVWGEPVTQNVTIPEDANYSLLAATWFTMPHGLFPGREMNPDPIYNLSERDYIWGFILMPNEGYEFPANFTAYINGTTDAVMMVGVVTEEMAAEEGVPAGVALVYTYANYTYEEGLHTLSTYGVGEGAYESIDRLLIERPNGAWMEPYHFQLYNDGTEDVEVVLIDFLHNNGYFSMDEETTEYPFTVDATGRPGVDLYINTSIDWNSTDEINSKLAVNTNERSTHLYQIVAAPYQPYCPDVVETAYDLGNVSNGTQWREYMSTLWDGPDEMELHANYDLPDFEENIPDGYDAVMKFTVDHPMNLNARVVEGYENGKVALYRADFNGEAGPMATNNYTGRPMGNGGNGGGGATGGAFEAVIGNVESPSTTSYAPYYQLYYNSISETLYTAAELSGAGVTTAPMTSLSWYANSNADYMAHGIQIWMANVSDEALTTTSHLTSGMTRVFSGDIQPIQGWNEFAFNVGNFAWDGHSNVLICVARIDTEWHSGPSWKAENVGFNAAAYDYDDYIYYDPTTTTYTLSNTNRPVITMKGGNRMVAGTPRGDRATATELPHLTQTRGGNTRSGSMTNWTGINRGSTAYGICVYNDGTLDYGINQFDIDNLASASVINDYDGIGGMVYNPNNGHFYVSNYTDSELYEIDANGNVLNTVGTDYAIVSLAWDQTTNTLYSMDSYGWLNITDPTTGEMTDIDALSNTDVMCITANANGQLYGVLYGDTSALVSIDKTNATVTTICTLNAGCNYAQSMAFDMNDNKLYWAQCYDDSNLYEINPTTGALTLKAANTSEICGLCIPAVATPVDPVTPVDPEVVVSFHEWSYGPVISGLNVLPGTYYLVASSTEEDYEVEIGVSELPCAENSIAVYPVDNAMGIDPVGVVLRWALSPDCNQYRLVFGTTYYPEDEPEHPQTIITEWSSNLAESYALPILWNNTNYFWRIEQRTGLSDENPGCVTVGDVFGFTTHLNVPQNLSANDETIFEDEPLTLTWNPVQDRTYRQYYIYKDGEQVAQTPNNPNPDPNASFSYTFPAGSLTYNMDGYNFYVTAVYDEGESAPSNEVNVKVSGYSNTTGINGHVYEQDGTTPIAGVTVTITGTDEFGDSHTYTTTTDANGYYHQVVYAGDITNAVATMAGYQDAVTIHALPFDVAYQGQEDNVDFIMDENFVAPANVCAQTVYAPGVTGDTLVQVYWDFNFCDPFEAQIGTGTTTTGYFPFYTLYNYSIATALYKAEELAAAGVNTAEMSSLSWYATNAPGYAQQGITIWMANVTDNTAPTTSPLASGMTKVYTGAMTPAMGWNEFVFNEGSFAWDGESNILILVQRNNGVWNSTVNWQGTNASGCMTYDYTDNAPYNVENQTYSLSTSSTRPNIIMKGVCDRQEEITRSLHHYNIYRTDCYNDGPYNSENTDFVATAWVPDTSYFDVGWPTLAPGVYKYGVSAVYAGNRDDVVDYPFEDRESEIVWHTGCGPCLDKDMRFEDVTVNVLLNSADNPAGSTVNFVNNNPGEEQNHPMGSITIDESALYAFESFRRGEYTVTVSHPGYITETHYIDLRDDNNYRDVFDEYDQEGNLVQHHDNTIAGHDLRFVLTEIIYNPINLYVSRTGWATWAPFIPEGGDTPIVPVDPTGGDNAFSFSFDNGMEGWTTIDADGDGLTWVNSANSMSASGYDYTGLAHSGENFVYSQSYIDYDGAYSADNYLVSPQMYSITSGSTLTFWADNANDSYPDNFSVVVSTVANPTANDFVAVYTHSGAKGGDRTAVRHNGNRYENWRQHTVNLGAYAGQNVWIAFRHNDYDEYEIWIDDVTLTAGRDDERHLEGYKVLCTSIDGQPIYNTNTVHPFCQLATENLVEGEQYICYVASIYSTGMSDYISCTWQYESCENYVGTVDGVHIDNNVVSWTYPGDGGDGPTPPPTGGSNFTVDFEGGMPEGWTVNDANNDGYTWCLTSAIPSTWTYYASLDLDWYHSGSNAICSGSYINGVGALNPNEYLISPQVNLVNGSQLSFWVAATDENYAADHFGVFVSTTGTNPSDFTSVQEWTLTAKRGAKAGDARATRDGEGMRLGNWYNYTVDLSAYAGQAYIAFRHFNCTDQYIMVLDDITLSTGAKGNFAYTEEDYIKMNSLAPRTENENVEPMPAIPGNRSNNAYACNAYGGTNPTGWITYNIDTPSNGTSLNSGLSVYGGSIAADGYVYATYNDNTWTKIDPLTGNVEGQGSLGMFFVDCAYDYTTDVMYGSYSGVLYTWDLATNTTAEVGAMHGSMQMIACDLNGQLYGIEYQTGDFYAIDKATAACTLIGNTGQSPAYVQSGGFDHETGKLYWAGYTSTGIFAEVNLSNGSLTMLGTNVGEQLSWSVPYEYNPAPVPVPASGEILGAMIFVDGEWEAFVEYPTNEYVYEGDGQEVCVRIVYNGPAELPDNNIMWSMSCEECEGGLEPGPDCEAGDPIYAEVLGSNDNVHIWWGAGVEPEPVEGDTWTYDFENSSMEGLQSVDADGDGYGWVLGTAIGGIYLVDGASLAGSGHNSSNDMICSGSYSNVVGALNPDNFLVFPQSTIVNGSTFSFWACAQDGSYAAEHFSVAVSADGNAWTNVQEWTMTAKGAKTGVRDARAQGSWHNYSVDLSDYAGQDVFIAIRHFNCTDMFILDVDDVELSINRATTDGLVGYNVYRSTDNVVYDFLTFVPVNDENLYEVFDAPEAGTYYYMVKALYEDGCESEGAIDGNNPQNHYVMVGVTGVGENSAEVSLFPNPTKGNVTIQAMGMHRITVVSVLGQVVYDTELDQDEFVLNMAQFNTGMYMVRVYTNDGVAVKRVTVMH